MGKLDKVCRFIEREKGEHPFYSRIGLIPEGKDGKPFIHKKGWGVYIKLGYGDYQFIGRTVKSVKKRFNLF